jgi:hypothetical protein
MNMKNKEQLLYFFLQGKISLSQYDYKFMANLQSIIQNNMRVTSNQAELFGKLISKYNKQLIKQGLVKEELKALPWKTLIVESTSEYTGAVVSLLENDLNIRVPFNKTFISAFRNVKNNEFNWSKETKSYSAPFSTNSLKIAYSTLPKFFPTVRYDDNLQGIINELKQYEGLIWNPTLVDINGNLMVASITPELAAVMDSITLSLDPSTLFKLSHMGIEVAPELIEKDPRLQFASNQVYEVEITDIEHIIGWMRNVGCENVMIGRGLRSLNLQENIVKLVEKYGMKPVTGTLFGNLPAGLTMLIQHTSPTSQIVNGFSTVNISKTIVLKDSRPIEVQ